MPQSRESISFCSYPPTRPVVDPGAVHRYTLSSSTVIGWRCSVQGGSKLKAKQNFPGVFFFIIQIFVHVNIIIPFDNIKTMLSYSVARVVM